MTREKRLRIISENMELFGPLPADYEEFVEQSVFKLDNIIIYSRNENKAYCTGCKTHTNDLKLFKTTLKHNHKAVCPCCGRYSVAKSKGFIKNGFDVVRWSMIVEKSDESVLIRYINHLRAYKNDGSYTQTTKELLRTVIGRSYAYSFGYYYIGWDVWKHLPFYTERSNYSEPREYAMLYNTDIKSDLKGSICEYSGVDIIVEDNRLPMAEDCAFDDKHIRQNNPYRIKRYLKTYVDKPYVEQLVKLGFKNLLSVAMGDSYYYESKEIFAPGKNRIHETLKLTRSEYLQLTTLYDPDCRDIKVLKKLRDVNMRVKNETYAEICQRSNNISTEEFISVRKYLSEGKSIKMLKQYGTKYRDYLDMAAQLRWNMKSTMVLFPKDFKQAHDIAVEQFNKQKQKNIRTQLKKVIQSHIYDFEDKNLMIVVPKSGAQIVKEGQVLHHCVARYVDSVAKQQTMILFVRHKDNPTKPFYTLEWKDGKVVQCYGLKDCDMTPEVQKFVNDFAKNMVKKMTQQRKGA